jgi:hypothetical protein
MRQSVYSYFGSKVADCMRMAAIVEFGTVAAVLSQPAFDPMPKLTG